MRIGPFSAAVLGTWLAACASAPPAPPPAPRAAADPAAVITMPALAGPIRFLADDTLAGRAPGTAGDRITRRYLASVMEMLGLEPGGPGGAWEQRFELIGVTSQAPELWRFRRAAGAVTLRRGDDFVAVSGSDAPQARVDDAEMVFVGYGIQAPEYDWDDFKGADLRGKVLLMLNDDPNWDPALFAGPRRLYYGRWTYKYESAARQGAAGAIIIHTTASAGYPWQTVRTSWGGENSRLPGVSGPALEVQAWITDTAAARLAAFAGLDLAGLVAEARARTFRPVPLGVTTSLLVTNRARRYETANVLGLLRGRPGTGRDETVIYTAHHDHLGTQEGDGGGDRIYNGALDNAAGVAQLLAVARALAALPEPPRRSVLFIAAAAEEQGLLGSEYYVEHPTVPPARMVANLNFDGANIWGRTTDVVAVGFGKTTLDRIIERAAATQGRVLVDERFPERGYFYRSDQFNFAKIGVPAVKLESGIEYRDRPPGWGRAQVDAWTETHYHQPSDELTLEWNFEGMIEDAQLGFWVGLALAESTEMPAWVPGDEFEAVRARALAGE